jgi:hypothetical protein
MGFIDDLVKLRYLAPLQESANATIGNINTFQSKDVVKDFLNQLQTNPDGSGRPGGASGLDLSSPGSIQKLLGMESGTMGKLLDISGGNMNTPEVKGIQGISDRILNAMNVGSEMTSRAGTTAYQQGELANRVDQTLIEKEKNRLVGLGVDSENALKQAQAYEAKKRGEYYGRMPSDAEKAQPKNAAEQQMQADWQTTAAQSTSPIIKNDLPLILKALQAPGNILDNMRKTVDSEYPKLSQPEREGKAQTIIKTLGGEFQTAKQGLLDEKNRAAEEIKKQSVVLQVQKNWDAMLTHANLVKQIKDNAERNKQPIPTDDEAEEIARQQYMKRSMKELGIDNSVSSNPLDLNIVPSTKRPLGKSGTW